MASYGTTSNTPRHNDDYLQQQNHQTPRHNDQQYQQQNSQRNRGNDDQNYNGFMKQRDEHMNPSNDYQSNKSLSLEYGKTIRLLRNGDEFFRGQKVVINSRKYRYFDVFLDDISDNINARFGAVRNIHTPINGHKIKSLDQIEDGKTYVAAGSGRFVRLNYLDISEGKRAPPHRLPTLNRQPDYSNIQIPQYDKTQNIYIYVYKNGDVLTAPAKVLLHKNTLASYDAVLNEVTNKVQLLNGAVLKLYAMENGEPIQSPAQLISGNCYVAANKEKFKKCEYFSPQDFNSVSPRLNRKSNSQPVSHTSSNASTSGKSTFSYSGKPYAGWHKENRDLPPVTGPKPNGFNQNRNQNKQLNVDRDDGGIYKARNNNNNNARTIQDSRDMYVDKPIDYRRADRVIEEEIDHKKNSYNPPQNTVAKPNSKQPPQQNNITHPDNNQNNPRKDSDNNKHSIPSNNPNEANKYNAHQDANNNNKFNDNNNNINHNNNLNTNNNNNNFNNTNNNHSLNNNINHNSNPNLASTSNTNANTNMNTNNNQTNTNNPKKELTHDEAAIKIQSSFRGYKTRSELRNKNPNAF